MFNLITASTPEIASPNELIVTEEVVVFFRTIQVTLHDGWSPGENFSYLK
jgi:hypothetical protein